MTIWYGCYDEITAEFENAVFRRAVENQETYYSEQPIYIHLLHE